MLQLLSLLQTHRYWPGGELAGRLEVSPRTVRRDVDRLRELGYPVRSERGSGGGYQLQAGAALPPLLLDDEEAVAIAVGLATAAGGPVAGIEETAVRALTKLVQVMPPRLRRRVDALQAATTTGLFTGPTVDAAALTVLAQACRDGERVRFTYAPRGREPALRTVDPHRLVALGRRWYVLSWDVERHDWRSFRVDRLTGPEPTGARFLPRAVPGGDAAAYVRASFDAAPTRYDVRVLVRAPAEDVRRAVAQWGAVEEVDATACTLRMGVDDLRWPLMLLAGVGAPFEVHGPPELDGLLRSTADLFLASTGGQTGRTDDEEDPMAPEDRDDGAAEVTGLATGLRGDDGAEPGGGVPVGAEDAAEDARASGASGSREGGLRAPGGLLDPDGGTTAGATDGDGTAVGEADRAADERASGA